MVGLLSSWCLTWFFAFVVVCRRCFGFFGVRFACMVLWFYGGFGVWVLWLLVVLFCGFLLVRACVDVDGLCLVGLLRSLPFCGVGII